MPQFTEDLAGIVYAPPRLWTTGLDRQNRLVLNFESETGGEYLVEQSPDLTSWTTFLALTNSQGATSFTAPVSEERAFFRARR